MEESFYKQALDNSSLAFSYNKIIYNKEGIPSDYIFLHVNEAFEKIMGIKRDSIIGKRFSEVTSNKKREELNFIFSYKNYISVNEEVVYEKYFKSTETWYRVYLYITGQNYFIAKLFDITKEKRKLLEIKKLMESFTENELIFHNIIENLPFSLSIVAMDGTILFVNETGINLFELNKTEEKQSSIDLWAKSKDRLNFIQEVKKNKIVKGSEYLFKTKKGKSFWAIVSGMKINYHGMECTLSTQHDISDRKEMENALKEGEEKFRLIFENTVESIAIIQNNKIKLCNNFAQKMTGYTMEEILKKQFINLVHKDDRDDALKAYRSRLSEQDNIVKRPYRIVQKNGNIVWVEMNGVKIKWNGKPAVQYFIIDITEQKNAEDRLKASEEKYRLLTEFASDVIWVFNYTKNKFTYVSPSIFSMLGYTPEEAMDINLETLIPHKFLEKIVPTTYIHANEFISNPNEPRTYMVEMQNVHKNGRLVWTEISSKYRYNAENDIEIVGVSRNIEERKNAEQKVLYLSFHDQLTGLFNRRYFEDEILRIDKEENLPLTIILADVNGLKLTNDVFGHITGDKLLVKISEVMKNECRYSDIIARIGGDEFIFLMPNTNEEDAKKIIERIKHTLKIKSGEKLVLSVAFGTATKSEIKQNIGNTFVDAENEMYQNKLIESNIVRSEIIKVITNTFYRKNKFEEAHNKRVGMLCGKIAQAMGMNENDVNEIVTAGMLHDIGKISMDERLIEKHEQLNNKDLKEYLRHPERGYQILKSSMEFAQVAHYVLSHHERVDGQGYPQGLCGDKIPVQSRIMAVANAFDMMTSPRGGQEKMSNEEAVKELIKNSGTQFDSKIVKVFVEKVLKKPYSL